ncbi:MAG: peroxiredoxin [Actinomycetales bacterium]
MSDQGDWTDLPTALPVPEDDGAADHLPGLTLPSVPLASTSDGTVDLASVAGSVVVYAYPRTGVPGEPSLVEDWDSIPGARGCTPESCGFRDHHAELAAVGADVLGLSTQDTAYQREAVERLHLPFALLSDEQHALTDAIGLPTLKVAGQRLLRRITLLVTDGRIERVWYPVFPPDTHAEEVLRWLRQDRVAR